MKILLVDDKKENVFLLETLLKGNGFEVASSVNGADALEKLRMRGADMIISDILMPVMDGFTLCHECKGDERLRHIPFVFYTATYTDEMDESLALRLGADKYIRKPAEPDEFVSIIRGLIGDVEKGRVVSGEPIPEDEQGVFRLYNERLVKKLEKRTLELESALAGSKRAEKALLDSERRYRLLAENITDVLWTMDMGMRFTYISPSVRNFQGFTVEEAMARTLEQTLTPASFRIAVEAYNEEIAMEKTGQKDPFRSRTLELEHICKDGSTVWAEVKTTFIRTPEDAACGLLGVTRDIQDRRQVAEEKKKLEAHLQRAQRLEAIGTLAGGVAHDFNNILSAIIGYTELADQDVAEGSKAKNSLKEVLKASIRARDLVKQILTFSRQAEQERLPIEIHTIVREALRLLRPSLPSTIEIRQNIAPAGPVLADATQMHQVVMNLCTNAYHALREKGGVLEVSLSQVAIDSYAAARSLHLDPGAYVRLTVSDTGHGMDKAIMDRIFDPYFTTKEKGEGTGLGLSTVHGIIQDSGGTVTVYSEPGKGTTFHVYLPQIECVKDLPEYKKTGSLPGGHERILFVDDEPALADMGRQMLTRLGYDVTMRTSSIEALALFRAEPGRFDLVITDVTMPHMTGEKLSQELVRIRPGIPIILCTGFSEKITEKQAGAMGIKKYVMKPILTRDLAHSVREALDG